MKVLTIFIPTFNRADVLDNNLRLLCTEISQKELPVAIVISDNASMDNTESVSKKYAAQFDFVSYKRNAQNLGADGNFLSCFELGSGKYTLLLGDDDYPISGQLAYLVNVLKNTEANLVHLKIGATDPGPLFEYRGDAAMKEISFWITYISSNIVKSNLAKVYVAEKYKGTLLAYVPLYMAAIYIEDRNTLIVTRRIFSDGVRSQNNGGYSYFKVFVENYNQIIREELPKGTTHRLLPYLMKDIFKKLLVDSIARLLIERNKGNYDTRDSWKILFKQYGLKPYAYINLIKHLIKKYV